MKAVAVDVAVDVASAVDFDVVFANDVVDVVVCAFC